VSRAVSIPVIASGGAGGLDVSWTFSKGAADAALAASIFPLRETSVTALKQHLRHHGIPVRL
jgi:cyclase